MTDAENDHPNRLRDGQTATSDGISPDKPALKKKCKELESELDMRARELNSSKSAIMQLLEQVQASKDGPEELGTPLPALLRRSTDSAASVLAASKQGRRMQSAAAHEWVQQVSSRDRIIAELRARNQALKDEMRAAVADSWRLQEQQKGDRRAREQHAAILQSVRGLKSQLEGELSVRKGLEAELAELRAKVKHEASKNAMHREHERVLDATLTSKQELLDSAHATLSALHQQYSALAQAALEQAGDEMQRLMVRSSTLLAQLAHERQSKRAAETRAAGLEARLAALQTARGVAGLADRAATADAWRQRATASGEQLDRLRGAYQHVRQQHAELRRQLEAGALAGTPRSDPALGSPSGGSDIVLRTPPHPQQPGPATPASGRAPLHSAGRAAALAAEVASIRNRIALLCSEFADDPAAVGLIL